MPKANTIPMFLAPATRGMRPHESRWLGTVDELAVAENLVFEHDLIQKDPAAIIYDPEGADTIQHSATLSAGPIWASGVSVLVARVPGTFFGASLATASAAAPANPWIVTAGLATLAGATIVLALARRDLAMPIASGIVDSAGNVYARLSDVAPPPPGPAGGPGCELWASVLQTTLPLGGTWSITLTAPAANVAVVAAGYGNLSSLARIDAVSLPIAQPAADTLQWRLTHAKTYPLIDLSVACWEDDTVTITWHNGYTQRDQATLGGAIPLRVALADANYIQSRAIVAQLDYQSTAQQARAGTVTVWTGVQVVIGNLTTFLDDLEVGDLITASGEQHRVISIQTQTQLTTDEPWNQIIGGVAYTSIDGPRLLTAVRGKIYGERPGISQTAPVANQGNLDQVLVRAMGVAQPRQGRFLVAGKESAGNDRKWFFVNGVDVPTAGVSAGAAAHDIASPAADWGLSDNPGTQPINGFVHSTSNRLCLFGNLNDAHRLYFADPDNHEDFATVNKAFTMRIASQIGERLYGAAEYQGVFWLFKYPVGIFYLDDSAIDFLQWSYRTRSDGLGCAPSPYAVLAINEDVLFMSPDGHVHLLSAVSNLGGVMASDLTRQLGLHIWTQQHIDTTRLETMTSCWNPYNKTAYFGCKSTTAGLNDNDLLLKFDFGLVNRGGAVRFSYSTVWHANSLCLKRRDMVGTPALMVGEQSTCYFVDPTQFGFRTDVLPGTTTPVTRGFASRQRTQSLDFAEQNPDLRNRRKHFRSVEFVFGDVLTQPVTCIVEVDGQVRQTLSLTATANRRVEQTLKCGDGYEIALDLQSDGSTAADLPLLGTIVNVTPGGADKSRKS